MRALLVHHADAVGPGVDPQRPLSELGRRQASVLAGNAAGLGVAPAAIWHSGKLRARQTAEAFLRTCAPFAEFKMVRGLLPDDPPEWMRNELLGEDRDVLLVGHMPNIAALVALLSGSTVTMPLHGAVGFDRSPDRLWRVVIGPMDPVRS